jgi:hypothetical protein
VEGSLSAADVLARLPDAAPAKAPEELDARITGAFAEDAKSVDVSRLLPEVEAAATAADAAAEEARTRALDPLLSPDEVKLARRDWEDAAFTRDRLCEAGKKLAERIKALKALERDRAQRAEHDRVLADRNGLAEEMGHMAEHIVRIAHLVSKIEACDRGSTQRRLGLATSLLSCRQRRPLSPRSFRTPWSGIVSLRSQDYCHRERRVSRGRTGPYNARQNKLFSPISTERPSEVDPITIGESRRRRKRAGWGHSTGFPKSYAKIQNAGARLSAGPAPRKREDGHVGLREAALLLFQFLVAMTLVGLDLARQRNVSIEGQVGY